MPVNFKEWTVDDLGQLPNDGLQYELLDGVLHVSAIPTIEHQVIRNELFTVLHDVCPPDLFALCTPVDWQPDSRTSLQPDVLVFPNEYLRHKHFCSPLVLAVEILSPSTRYRDLVLKRDKYASSGVSSYWVVDPDVPSILAGDLVDGRYRVVAEVAGSESVDLQLPFPVTLCPAALVSRWRRLTPPHIP